MVAGASMSDVESGCRLVLLEHMREMGLVTGAMEALVSNKIDRCMRVCVYDSYVCVCVGVGVSIMCHVQSSLRLFSCTNSKVPLPLSYPPVFHMETKTMKQGLHAPRPLAPSRPRRA
jgi:hypothetical protein